MPKSCVAYNCTNRFVKGSGVSFHKFPFSDENRLRLWIRSLRRENFTPTNHSFLCSVHFSTDCFYENHIERRLLRDDAIPTLFDFPEHLKKELKPRKPPMPRLSQEVVPCISSDGNTSSIPHVNNNIVYLDHAYFISESPRKLKRKYEELLDKKENELIPAKKNLKICKTNILRNSKKIKNFKDIIKALKSNNLVNLKLAEILEKNFDGLTLEILKRELSNHGSYTEELKCFALTLFFYSPKAYEYVRSSFKLCLPHPVTIRRWYNIVDGSPGFTAEALSSLKEQINNTGYSVYVALMFDEMSIRKHLDWDGKEFFGYTTFGKSICQNQPTEAKEVLVFMVVAINASFSIPISYFLVDGVSAEEKASLITHAISILHDVGANVVSVTFDGTSTNFAAAELLGAKLLKPLDLKVYITHPVDPLKKVYIIPDACHMVKLMRNVFAEKLLCDSYGRIIQWQYIEKLNYLQTTEGLHLANKINNRHLQFYQNKMKVSLAVQVLSSSVAEALKFVNQSLQLSEFEGSEATIDFCLLFNQLFDLCNSKNPIARGYKAAMKESNKSYWEAFLRKAENYLINLEDHKSKKLLYETPRETPIIGFLCICKSLKGLFSDLVSSGHLRYIPTYKFSQDHLEMVFSRIRQRGGWNNNPSATQFRASFKQLLVRNAVKASICANATSQDDTKLLHCFSVSPNLTESIFMDVTAQRFYNYVPQITSEMPEKQTDDFDYFQIPSELSEYTSNIIVYIAGYVVKKLSDKISCPDCSISLLEEDDILEHGLFLQQKNNGGLKKPSQGVVDVCTLVEKCIRNELAENCRKLPGGNVKNRIVSKVLNHTLGQSFFPNLEIHALDSIFPDNHVLSLIRAIVGEFLKVRFHHLAKMRNITLKGKNIRQTLTKLVLFKNQ